MTLDEIRDFLRYNEWANARMMRAVEAAGFDAVREPLAHIVAVEWVWLMRWQGSSPTAVPEWAANPTFDELRAKLADIERERQAFIGGLSEEDLGRRIRYRNLKGEEWEYPLGDLLLHYVNHSTYHRGQVAMLLRKSGATPAPTDLLLYYDART